RYARGRDYHKTMRGRLKTLATKIRGKIGDFESRPFADSAPIFEKSLAESAGMGWTGKHTLLIHKHQAHSLCWVNCLLHWNCPLMNPRPHIVAPVLRVSTSVRLRPLSSLIC